MDPFCNSSSTSSSSSTKSDSFSQNIGTASVGSDAQIDRPAEFTLNIVRTGHGDDEFRMWVGPITPTHIRVQPDLEVVETIAMEAAQTIHECAGEGCVAIPVEQNQLEVEVEVEDQDPIVIPQDPGYDADVSSIMEDNDEEDEDEEDNESKFWIEVHWDSRNGPLEDIVGK
ncbi:hypothetical protein BO71DRAFT_407565 [Aspergillus ellipticus CBS 707.79]|uniref:Uncharacterized protein n=1 Tax=Aspergillus ellipticus CBS 707.79 TaxID=1448320 RepID=A0A319DH08_9EURO|nr:hypothetical protein BO71DRAFT_407565 [Aspergillus ellipticus CBS 707.79]